jgi:hypothetical protein
MCPSSANETSFLEESSTIIIEKQLALYADVIYNQKQQPIYSIEHLISNDPNLSDQEVAAFWIGKKILQLAALIDQTTTITIMPSPQRISCNSSAAPTATNPSTGERGGLRSKRRYW